MPVRPTRGRAARRHSTLVCERMRIAGRGAGDRFLRSKIEDELHDWNDRYASHELQVSSRPHLTAAISLAEPIFGHERLDRLDVDGPRAAEAQDDIEQGASAIGGLCFEVGIAD